MSDSILQISSEKTFFHVLRGQASERPERRCYTFLKDGESAEVHLTAGDLDRRARAIAARLQGMGLTGGRAFLFHPAGTDFIAALFGCFYAGVTAVPAYPPRANRSIERLEAMAESAEASIILTTSNVTTGGPPNLDLAAPLRSMSWVATDLVPDDEAVEWSEPKVAGTDLAVLQFTSGSTETPKGVMLSHSNLLHNSALISRALGHSRDSVGVAWLPPFHDMGLIGGILQPLYSEFTGILLSPVDFVRRPFRWLQAISRYRAVTSGGPNFAYDLCVRSIRPEQRAQLDLSCWKVAFTGAEPVHAATLERFAEAFASCGFRREAFYPCYGLAEATLIVSGGARGAGAKVLPVRGSALERHDVLPANPDDTDSRPLVSCGAPLPSVGVTIVDPATGVPCPPGRVGEVWVSGPSVAQGYWRRPEETVETFQARAEEGGQPHLRTGDLGFLHDGELFITGRIKELIIIRGRNHYPQDIERVAEASHEAIRPGHLAAFSVSGESEERLVVVAELQRGGRGTAAAAVAAAVRRVVGEAFGLQVDQLVLIRTGSLPRTSSGKIQRSTCRAALLAGELNVVEAWSSREAEPRDSGAAPRTIVECQLAEIWAQVLGRESVGIRENFFDLGGASIQVMQVVDAAAQVGIALAPEMFFEHQTIADLASVLDQKRDLIVEPRSALPNAAGAKAA
jgi:acyl-CoA synthetase (AMP-forming)/AMP-acid ligase II